MAGGADIRTPNQQTPRVSVKWPLVGKIVSLQSVIALYKENPGEQAAPGRPIINKRGQRVDGTREVASWR